MAYFYDEGGRLFYIYFKRNAEKAIYFKRIGRTVGTLNKIEKGGLLHNFMECDFFALSQNSEAYSNLER